MRSRENAVRNVTILAVLTALVVVLQFIGSFIHLGMFSISLVLLPIVIGASLCGPVAGAWLGLVFAVVVIASGDAAAFMAVSPGGTFVTVFAKGILAGLISGLVYKAVEKKNVTAAVLAAAIVCPIVNTGVFFGGCVLFFLETISEWGASLGFENALKYMIFGLAGGNFLFELLFNVVLAPAAVRVIQIAEKGMAKR